MIITSGARGLEADDWAEALFDMYKGFCALRNFEMTEIEKIVASTGLTSVTVQIDGE